jgi:hypothetical protein
MRMTVKTGIRPIEANTGRVVNISASFPVKGVSKPPIPQASPIIRLKAIDLAWGASLYASATPSGRGARMKKPDKKAKTKIQLPVWYTAAIMQGVAKIRLAKKPV